MLAGAALGATVWFYLDTFGTESFGLSPGYGLYLCAAASTFWLGWMGRDYRRTNRGRRRPPRRPDGWR